MVLQEFADRQTHRHTHRGLTSIILQIYWHSVYIHKVNHIWENLGEKHKIAIHFLEPI